MSGFIPWDGYLDLYGPYGQEETDWMFCESSTVFAEIEVMVRNTGWMNAPVTQDVLLTFTMPRIAITQPTYDDWVPTSQTIPCTVMKSSAVTEPLTLTQWSCSGIPSSGIGSGFATSYTTPGQYRIDATLNRAGGNLQTGTTVTVYRISLAEVDYTGGHTVNRDIDPQTAYAPPHWKDANFDGDADDLGERKYPHAYTRQTTMTATTRWISPGRPPRSAARRLPRPGIAPRPFRIQSRCMIRSMCSGNSMSTGRMAL